MDSVADAPARGVVRLAAPLMFGLSHVAPAVHDFLVHNPDIRLEVTYDDAYRDLVEEGVDVAVRGGQLEDSTLVARKLFTLSGGLFAAPGAVSPLPTHPSELRSLPMLMNRRVPIVLRRGDIVESVRIEPRLLVRATQARLLAAQAGLGIALLPDFVDTSALVRVLPEWQLTSSFSFHLLRPSGRPSPAARALWKHLTEALEGLSPPRLS